MMKKNSITFVVYIALLGALTGCMPADFSGSSTYDGFSFSTGENSVNAGDHGNGNNAPISASFQDQFSLVKEGDSVLVKVILDSPAKSTFILEVESVSGEAQLGSDLVITRQLVEIQAGASEASFAFQILVDNTVEKSETFFLKLKSSSSQVKLSQNSHTIIIQDTTTVVTPPPTLPNVNFGMMAATASEVQGSYQIAVMLDAPSTKDVSVSLAINSAGGALEGQDFNIVQNRSLLIPANTLTGIITVSLIDDTVVEQNESFIVSLVSAVNAQLGSATTFNLTILDNDVVIPDAVDPTASLALASVSVVESQGNYSLPIILDKASAKATTISFNVNQAGGAMAGQDFTLPLGSSVTIPAGQTSGSLSISIIDDTAVENAESVSLSIASVQNGKTGNAASFTLNIIDNDAANNNVPPVATLGRASMALTESEGSYSLPISLNKVSTQAVTISFALDQSGGAIQNQDFTLPLGDSIVIPAGQVSASLIINVTDDAITENTESVSFSIANIQNATVGAISSFNFSIMDNDAPVANPNLAAFKSTLYDNVLRNQAAGKCLNCHSPDGQFLQINPFHSHVDPAVALQTIELIGLVNLANPSASRLVTKVAGGHNAWSGNAAADAALIQSYIEAWAAAAGAGAGAGNNNKIATNSLTISEGQAVAGTARYAADQIGFWDFKKGADEAKIYDSSGVAPAIDLDITGDIKWLPGQGITCNKDNTDGKAQAPAASSKKIYDRVMVSKQYTVEAWISSDNPAQSGPTRIVSYSSGTSNRNFTVGQAGEYFNFRNRNAQTGDNGAAPAYQPQTAKFITDRPATQHLVMVYDGKGRSMYVNGAKIMSPDGALSQVVEELGWSDGYNFTFCNETTNNRAFQGSIFMAAVHDKALTGAQILQNYDAGFTKKVALQFDVAAHTNPGAKLNVQVEVSGKNVIMSNLKFSGLTSNVDLSGIKFAVNGTEAIAGQSYSFLESNNTANDQILSAVSSTIETEDMGVDKISVIFQELGNKSQLEAPVLFSYEGNNTAAGNPEASDSALLRLFSEIYQSMANVTGVPASNTATSNVYKEVKNGLPTDPSISTFSSSHQINIIKVAYEFCSQMVDDAGTRNAFYGNLNVGLNASALFNATTKQQVADTIVTKMIGSNLAGQASSQEVAPEVTGLIDEMVGRGSSSADILKGTCLLGLGSMNNIIK